MNENAKEIAELIEKCRFFSAESASNRGVSGSKLVYHIENKLRHFCRSALTYNNVFRCFYALGYRDEQRIKHAHLRIVRKFVDNIKCRLVELFREEQVG